MENAMLPLVHLYICLRFDVDRMRFVFSFVIQRNRITWKLPYTRMHTKTLTVYRFYVQISIWFSFAYCNIPPVRLFALQYIAVRSFKQSHTHTQSLTLFHSICVCCVAFLLLKFYVSQLLPNTLAYLIGKLRFISFATQLILSSAIFKNDFCSDCIREIEFTSLCDVLFLFSLLFLFFFFFILASISHSILSYAWCIMRGFRFVSFYFLSHSCTQWCFLGNMPTKKKPWDTFHIREWVNENGNDSNCNSVKWRWFFNERERHDVFACVCR